jgi:hypothetical protein
LASNKGFGVIFEKDIVLKEGSTTALDGILGLRFSSIS